MRALWAVAATALAAHPLHTTLTQLSYSATDRTVEVSVRAFADDFRAAAGGVSDSTAFAYLLQALTLTDAEGHVLPLSWCGARQTADLLWLCLRADGVRGLRGVHVHARMLFDLYPDQINIVRATYEGRRASLLFSRGGPAKALP